MFNNLIESSSHKKEFKRRGSFLLFTTSVYLVLFTITGVVSIYAYDTHLENQVTEYEVMFIPPPMADEAKPKPRPVVPRSANVKEGKSGESTRTVLVASASDHRRVPDQPGIKASDVPPANTWTRLGPANFEPAAGPGSKNVVSNGTGDQLVANDSEPPPAPDPAPASKPPVPEVVRKSTIINGLAVLLPKPRYPQMANTIKLQGVVNVQVLINEEGNVISAKAVSGHPILIPEAQRAAMMAKFSPTVLSGQRVKVSGIISYKFELAR